MLNSRLFSLCLILPAVLLFANAAEAGGIYQRTKDRRARVWNNYPEPGDVAEWSGGRDKDGYASGYGTLIWYTTKRGAIVTGSNIPSVKRIAVSRYSGTMVEGKFESVVENVDANGKTFHGTFADGRKTGEWVAGAAPARAAIAVKDRQEEEPIHRAETIETAVAAPAEGPREIKTEKVEPGAAAGIKTTAKSNAEIDDSLRSLVGPPPLLRKKTVVSEPAPVASMPPATTAAAVTPPPAAGPRLTTAEVIDLANAEALRHGYNVREYQRPQPDFNAADGTWSISYEQKLADGFGKHFSMRVEDKSKKASIAADK